MGGTSMGKPDCTGTLLCSKQRWLCPRTRSNFRVWGRVGLCSGPQHYAPSTASSSILFRFQELAKNPLGAAPIHTTHLNFEAKGYIAAPISHFKSANLYFHQNIYPECSCSMFVNFREACATNIYVREFILDLQFVQAEPFRSSDALFKEWNGVDNSNTSC